MIQCHGRLLPRARLMQYEVEAGESGAENTMASAIRFGTSGWRAVVAEEFTMANIRLAVAGIAAFVKTQPEPHRVLVGRDPRFLGESFVAEAARVLAGMGVTPIVIPEAAPTPAIAYAVSALKTSGAINFTASHNPPEYNGIKFSTHDGAPALPEVTKQIEAAIATLSDGYRIADTSTASFDTTDVKPAFLKRLAELVDLKAIAKSKIKLVYDPFWGAGRGYSSDILREAGVSVETVHDFRDVKSGGILIYEKSTILHPPTRQDIDVLALSGIEEAQKLKSKQVANMVLLGAFLELRPIVKLEHILSALHSVLPPHRQHLIPLNEQALVRGKELAIEVTAETAVR